MESELTHRRNGGTSTYTHSDTQKSPYRAEPDATKTEHYIFLHRPDGFSSLFKELWCRLSGFVESSDSMSSRVKKLGWRFFVAQVFLDILFLFSGPLAILGKCVEFPGNFYSVNGGSTWQILVRLFKRELIIPQKRSQSYHSLIGQLDPRTKLHVDKNATNHEAATPTIFPGSDAGARSTGDVLVMASKLAYENEEVVKKVVTNDWNMNFVIFKNCWNDSLKKNSTQVFVFTDKEIDANAIVIAWRGTEPFNAMDWCTDFDFSWFALEGMGKVHVGFLEALGLANRDAVETFQRMRKKADAKWKEQRDKKLETSGLSQAVIDNRDQLLAYDDITETVRDLLEKHPTAKLYVTGHSLGGALAALYTGMLYYNGEKGITEKLAAVYTFGQPRVGDVDFAKYMKEHLTDSRYFRVVYCNDMVPRIPFDDNIFGFKHFGYCFYYTSQYKAKCLEEAPRKNFFYFSDFLSIRVTAIGELIHACRPADPEFAESWTSILARVLAFFVPGIGSHSPVNYVNAVRLGAPSPLVAKITEGIHEIDERLHDWEDRTRAMIIKWFYSIFQLW